MLAKFVRLAMLSAGLAAAGQHAANADATTEAQLRAALQSATSQIAALEDQVANLQASQAPEVATIEALRAQLQTLQGAGNGGGGVESSAEKAKNDAELTALRRQLSARNAALAQSRSDYETAQDAANNAAAQNSALKAQLTAVNAGLASCKTKNTQLVDLSNQILAAYSHKDELFGTIADREPFIGFKRVQLQNIVQDDQNKIDDNQMTTGTSP